MNKYFLAFILFTAQIFCMQSFGQTNHGIETDTAKLLIGKWKMIAIEMDGKKANLPASDKSFFEFKSDGGLVISESGRLHSEEWSYDKKANMLVTDDEKSGITKINQQELVLFSTDQKDKMHVYFKREK